MSDSRRRQRVAGLVRVPCCTPTRSGGLTQITDAAFAEYRADPGVIADMRHRFTQWRRELLAPGPS
jgi:hypothetical protein